MSNDWRTAYLARVRALHGTTTNGFYADWEGGLRYEKPNSIVDSLTQAQRARLGYGKDERVYECAISTEPIHARDVFLWGKYTFDIDNIKEWFKTNETHPATRERLGPIRKQRLYEPRTMILRYHTQVQRENGVRFRPLRERYVLTDGQVEDYSAWDLDGNSVPNAPVPPPPPANHTIVFREYESGRPKYYYETIDGRRTEVIGWKDTADGEITASYIVASGSLDGTIRLWDTAKETQIKELNGHTDAVNSVAFSPDGEYIASGSRDKTMRLWNVSDGTQVEISSFTQDVQRVAFSPDGKLIVNSLSDGSACLWDVGRGDIRSKTPPFGRWKAKSDGVLSPSGKLIAFWNVYDVLLRNVTSGEQVATISYNRSVTCAAFSPDDIYIAICFADTTMRLWNVVDRREVKEFIGLSNDYALSVAFSPDGMYIVTGAYLVSLWNVADGRRVKKFIGHTDRVLSVAFSPDGEFILSGSLDRSIRLWDAASGEQVQQMTGHKKDVLSVEGVLSVALAPLQQATHKRQRINA